MVKRNRAAPGMLRGGRVGKRRALQDAVNAGDGVLHDHAILAHEHQLCQRQRDDRRDNDIKEQVQQYTAVRSAVGKQKAACN